MKKIIVTGGHGFIGTNLIKLLLKNEKYHVINVDCLTYAANQSSLAHEKDNPRYHLEKINICNQEGIRELFFKHKPNIVMHLAAESHVDRSIEKPMSFIQTNVIGTTILLEEARSYFLTLSNKSKENFRFHHISTDEVFGDLGNTSKLFTEHSSYSPSSPYSASKAGSDHLVRAWGRTFNLPIIISNCSNNYGPYQFPEKLIPHTILNAIHGKPIPIYGNGKQIRDWLYVEDHVQALLKVITYGEIGETYNIGGHNEKTNLEVVETICDLLEKLLPVKPHGVNNYKDLITHVKDRPGHDLRYAVDASKIKCDLGWVPEESFQSGISKTIKWYLKNNEWWERVLSGEYRLERIGKGL